MVESAQGWLPAELYSLVAHGLATADLHAMMLTSRVTNGAATPFLYQRIVLQPSTSLSAITSILDALINAVDLAKMVQHFVVNWTGPSNGIQDVASRLQTSFPRLVNLQHLAVSRSLDTFSWIFDDVTFPVLRDFHCFAKHRIPLSFLDRHPNLRTLTINLPRETDGIRHWGSETEEINLWDGHAGDLLHLFQDGELRPALRRFSWTGVATPSDLRTLATQCPNVERVNHLVITPFYHHSIGAQWPSVRRLGVMANPKILGYIGNREHLRRCAAQAHHRFPNINTLDVLIRDVESLSSEALAAVDAAVQLVHEVQAIQLVTAVGKAYIRGPGEAHSGFFSVSLRNEHSAPTIPLELMFKRTYW